MENFSEIFDITDKETYDKYSVCKRYSTYVLKNNKVLLQTGKGDPTKWLEIIEEDEIEFERADEKALIDFANSEAVSDEEDKKVSETYNNSNPEVTEESQKNK